MSWSLLVCFDVCVSRMLDKIDELLLNYNRVSWGPETVYVIFSYQLYHCVMATLTAETVPSVTWTCAWTILKPVGSCG